MFTNYLDSLTKCVSDSLVSYYHAASNNFDIFLGDNRELLPYFKDNSVDAIFADPPYFLSNGGISCQNGRMVCVDKGEWDKGGTPEHIYEFNKQWLAAVRSKLKPNGTIWISGTFHNIFTVATCLTELGYKILNIITWQKTNPAPNLSCKYFVHSTELVIWARKEQKVSHYFNYDLMRHLNGDKQMSDVWRLPTIAQWEKTCGKHPTQKPLSLLTRIVLASTPENGIILDPFTGSSTTGIAANLVNRRFVGIDQEEQFLQLSQRRREELNDPRRAAEMRLKITDIRQLEFEGLL